MNKIKKDNFDNSKYYVTDDFKKCLETQFSMKFLQECSTSTDIRGGDFTAVMTHGWKSKQKYEEIYVIQSKYNGINPLFIDDALTFNIDLCKNYNGERIPCWGLIPPTSDYTLFAKHTKGADDWYKYPLFMMSSKQLHTIVKYICNKPKMKSAIDSMYKSKDKCCFVSITIDSPKIFEMKLLRTDEGCVALAIEKANYDRLSLMCDANRSIFLSENEKNDFVSETQKESIQFLRKSNSELINEINELKNELTIISETNRCNEYMISNIRNIVNDVDQFYYNTPVDEEN